MTSLIFVTPGEPINDVQAWIDLVPEGALITIDTTTVPGYPQLVCTYTDVLVGVRVFVYPDLADAAGQTVALS